MNGLATVRTLSLHAIVFGAVVLALGSGCGGCDGPTDGAPAVSASSGAAGPDVSPELRARLEAAVRAKGPDYVPRTRHRRPDGSPIYTNRLVLEASPYLQQHAHNPVNWFPWGEEAFAVARATGRPIFLSVGYSTCHWCHVMEEESFEDEAIAAYLNASYVAIKVDREERPDVDAVYMKFLTALTGSGGWPMNVWLMPDKTPFYAGTYFPPHARGGRPGLREVLELEKDALAADPDAVARRAGQAVLALGGASTPSHPPAVDRVIARALEDARAIYDPVHGGRRGAPKFPSSFPVRFLLGAGARLHDSNAVDMATSTLTHMRAGGIYDQIGGGFHRYSTDAAWRVPHFEKMLYDNAELAVAYLDASAATDEPAFGETTREILDYLLLEMVAPDGTFFAATDADSPAPGGAREEGRFFTWTPAELAEALGAQDAPVAARAFGVTARGDLDGRSISWRPTPTEAASSSDGGLAGSPEDLARIRAKLYAARAKRPPPPRDDKVIVAWNALTITALARAGLVLGEARYADAAIRAGTALTRELDAGAGLPHQRVDGASSGAGFADDHAFLAAAMLDLFELTADPKWLDHALSLMRELDRSFLDSASGGYFMTGDRHEALMLRDLPSRDGPVPSPSSVAALTWLRLADLTGDAKHRARAESVLAAFGSTLERSPLALDAMLLAAEWFVDAPREIVVVLPDGGGATAPEARRFLDVLQRVPAPNALVLCGDAAVLARAAARVPWAADKPAKGKEPTAYLCVGRTCQLPTNDPATFEKQLRASRASPD